LRSSVEAFSITISIRVLASLVAHCFVAARACRRRSAVNGHPPLPSVTATPRDGLHHLRAFRRSSHTRSRRYYTFNSLDEHGRITAYSRSGQEEEAGGRWRTEPVRELPVYLEDIRLTLHIDTACTNNDPHPRAAASLACTPTALRQSRATATSHTQCSRRHPYSLPRNAGQ
jgi:hypothetical protein